jgi:hypothetical protein
MNQFYDWRGEKKACGIRLAVMDRWKPFLGKTSAKLALAYFIGRVDQIP